MKFDLFDDRDTQKGNKLRTFRQFKCKIRQENYLCTIQNVNLRKNITKLRLSAHNLPIETGRYKRPVKIPPNLRLCEECNMNLVGDEFHIIMKCDKYRILRKDFFDKMNTMDVRFIDMDCQEKFLYVMKLEREDVIENLCSFIKNIVSIRGNF